MEIEIPDNRLRRSIEDDGRRVRSYGAVMAKKIRIRMTALKAAESLADFWPPNELPERCHELKGELSGTFSIDLVHPFRLLFKPFEIVRLPETNEIEWWQTITRIQVIDIQDTHG